MKKLGDTREAGAVVLGTASAVAGATAGGVGSVGGASAAVRRERRRAGAGQFLTRRTSGLPTWKRQMIFGDDEP